MAEPQLSIDNPLLGRIRGRGWSPGSAWSLRLVDGGAVLRGDDPDHSDLWIELEILPSNMALVSTMLLSVVLLGARPHELRPHLLRLTRSFAFSYCSTCGSALPKEPRFFWCSEGCYDSALLALTLEGSDADALLTRELRRFYPHV